ncbi:MAG: hypothetical protein JO216_06170 [Hyphomicrobiales bacterium]|nr:hypothetical protein [Hyphomicrobiales bacterium]
MGTETPVALYAGQNEGLWLLILVFGTLISGVVVIIVAVPLYLALFYRNKLTLLKAILIGGTILTGSYLLFITISLLNNNNNGFAVLRSNGETLIWNSHITMIGILEYYLIVPLEAFALGAISALAGWLMAVGFRLRPIDYQSEDDFT